MIQLTPELQCFSRFAMVKSGVIELVNRQLNFNLSRRTGVVINSIESTINVTGGNIIVIEHAVQELDLDPDNTDIWTENCTGDDVEYDSSRLLIHSFSIAGNGDAAYWNSSVSDHLLQDWRAFAMNDRPISITPMSHRLALCGLGQSLITADSLICIRYLIVELSLTELGILNATRR